MTFDLEGFSKVLSVEFLSSANDSVTLRYLLARSFECLMVHPISAKRDDASKYLRVALSFALGGN